MTCMFYGATSFRQPITAWKLSSQSTRGIFLDLPDYRDMESRVMCLATLDGNNREYELQEMIEILGEKEVQDALRIHGAKYGLKEYLQNNGE
ncbi:MAG: BspA family leucine-rich repeat surface protein [Parabacteroides sp.]|nr:BspA family leucine-rich repeat surface protein [Parabacteroides sp.]